MKKIKLAVIFGGESNEYEVSLKSAFYIIENLPKNLFEIFPIGIDKIGNWFYYTGPIKHINDGIWNLNLNNCKPVIFSSNSKFKGFLRLESNSKCFLMKIDCVFMVLHGRNGEDGRLQGLFEIAKIPFVGCGLLSSACCMDKDMTHKILENSKINTTKFLTIKKTNLNSLPSFCKEVEKKLNFPLFVKAANSGSSIGVFKCKQIYELEKIILKAFDFDEKVVCEQAVNNCKEIECAVLGNNNPIAANYLGEIKSKNEFYDFDSKYKLKSELIIPAQIKETVALKVKQIAVQAFKIMECKGLARIDFLIDEHDEIFLNEINTLPGFTEISMFPKLWAKSGMAGSSLLVKLVNLAMGVEN